MSRHNVVLDIGKTLSKLTLWAADGTLIERRTRPNERIAGEHYAALDAAGIEAWLTIALTDFAALAPIGAIIPVGHGAAAAVLKHDQLVYPAIDYEHPLPAETRECYDAQRDPFCWTGSPALPDGLNLGAQLHLLEELDRYALDGATILPWPQYWAWKLSGVAASEVTSLGCHSDLWQPLAAAPSSLATTRGWANHLAPVRPANEALGYIRPDWARRTGLPRDVKIYCGLHDSNAALLAARGFEQIADNEATVLSTGTWFVAMRTPGADTAVNPRALPEARDCLVNVDAFGKPVPSARFMGGREIETLTGIDTRRIDIALDQPTLVAAVPAVLRSGAMVLPTFAGGVGPYPHARGRWVGMPSDEDERRAAVSLYAALVTDVSLDLIGTRDRILVEGRFAEAQVFVRALASLRPGTAVYTANTHNDVSFGALRLLNPDLRPKSNLIRVEPLGSDLSAYRDRWRLQADALEVAA